MDSGKKAPNAARAIAAAFAAAIALKSFFADLMVAEGRSMLPAIEPGSVLLINRAAYGLRNPLTDRYAWRWGAPKSGDVVVFPSPDGLLAVKRCRPAEEAGKFMALGDNEAESYDSRNYGPVSIDSIRGKVMGVK